MPKRRRNAYMKRKSGGRNNIKNKRQKVRGGKKGHNTSSSDALGVSHCCFHGVMFR
jgi:hypothetical protein